MKIQGIITKLLVGTANLLNMQSRTPGWSVLVFENGKATEVIV